MHECVHVTCCHSPIRHLSMDADFLMALHFTKKCTKQSCVCEGVCVRVCEGVCVCVSGVLRGVVGWGAIGQVGCS